MTDHAEKRPDFDPYHAWLGIPPAEQPPTLYRLLGLSPFESNLDVIEQATDRQMGHVRTHQGGSQGAISQQLLNELAAARVRLLDAVQKTRYDADLKAKQAASPLRPAPVAVPTSVAVAAAPLPIPRAGRLSDRESAASATPSIEMTQTTGRESSLRKLQRKFPGQTAGALAGLAGGVLLTWIVMRSGGDGRAVSDVANGSLGNSEAETQAGGTPRQPDSTPVELHSAGEKSSANNSIASPGSSTAAEQAEGTPRQPDSMSAESNLTREKSSANDSIASPGSSTAAEQAEGTPRQPDSMSAESHLTREKSSANDSIASPGSSTAAGQAEGTPRQPDSMSAESHLTREKSSATTRSHRPEAARRRGKRRERLGNQIQRLWNCTQQARRRAVTAYSARF